jgi:hypothetical protein
VNTKSFSQKLITRRFMEHGNCQPGNYIGHQSLDQFPFCQRHCTPSYGQKMEYVALMKDPYLHPLWKRCFGNEVGRLFQASTTFKSPTHVSLLNSIPYTRTDRSHMEKLSVTISLTKRKRKRQAKSGW